MNSDALRQLANDLDELTFVEVADEEGPGRFTALCARSRRLLEVKLLFESVRGADAPPIVVIAGGTNVGKSTVFNWVVGEAVASSSPLARHTKAPTVYAHAGELSALKDGHFLPRYQRLALTTQSEPAQERSEGAGAEAYFLLRHERDEVKGVVLIDSPDIDSTHARNREVAEDLLFLADAVLFVATPEKYNDQLCVDYMSLAARLGKGLTCVLNKGADEAVTRDVRDVLLPRLDGDARLLELPYTPNPEPATQASFRGELQALVLQPREEAAGLREGARRGAQQELARGLVDLIARLRQELAELDRIRSEVTLVLDAGRDDYARFLNGLEFYELDQVYERVLQEFRIPVLDHIYDGFRGAIGFVSSNVGRLVSGRAPEDGRQTKVSVRAEKDRLKLKELLGTARAAVSDLPERHTQVLRESAPAWVQGLASPDPEVLNAQIDSFLERAHAASERWIEGQTREHVALIEDKPALKNALRGVKGVLQIGFGLLSAKLTGGFGPWDVLIGSAAQAAVKPIIEAAGGHLHYQKIKVEFVKERAALARDLLEESVALPLVGQLPAGVAPDRLDRLDAALDAARSEA